MRDGKFEPHEKVLGSNVHSQFDVSSTADIETLKSIVGSVQHHVKQAETAWKSAKVDLEYIQDALSNEYFVDTTNAPEHFEWGERVQVKNYDEDYWQDALYLTSEGREYYCIAKKDNKPNWWDKCRKLKTEALSGL